MILILAHLTAFAATPPFTATVRVIDTELSQRMIGTTWYAECPVPLDDLRQILLRHHDTNGNTQLGTVIVHKDVVKTITDAFSAAYADGFPIYSLTPIHEYGGDDNASMAANNTSAFNCRRVGGTNNWSEHAYGTAIDINPSWNPYVVKGRVFPPDGRAFSDRTEIKPGMLTSKSEFTKSFLAHDWGWGGTWSHTKDYQHFSKSGK
jgi:hypothetical protein